MDANRLLTRDEVQDRYGIGKRFLEVAAMRNEGPAMVKLGHRTVRYRVCDIEDWIEAQTSNQPDYCVQD